MAVIGSRYTLADYYAQRDPDGASAKIHRIMSQTNDIIDTMLWAEGNLATGHQATIEVGRSPSVWRRFNQGVPYMKGVNAKVTFETHSLERASFLDEALADLGGDLAGQRMNNAEGHFDQIAQDLADRTFYGSDDGNGFAGFAEYASADTGLNNSGNVIDGAGSSSNNTSVYFIGWGRGCHMIHPKGTKPGIQHIDRGKQKTLDADGNAFFGWEDNWKVPAGLAANDWRWIVRIANIDVPALKADTSNALLKLLNLMDAAAYKWPSTPERGAIYCNRDILTALSQGVTQRATGTITREEANGKRVLHWNGIPIGRCDALLNSEAHIA